MRLQKVQDALNKKNIKFEYTEEDGGVSTPFFTEKQSPPHPFRTWCWSLLQAHLFV